MYYSSRFPHLHVLMYGLHETAGTTTVPPCVRILTPNVPPKKTCTQDVDDIHEYLLLKGVDAVSIHGGKEQEERNEAILLFKVRAYI